jgi:hypothetical protein
LIFYNSSLMTFWNRQAINDYIHWHLKVIYLSEALSNIVWWIIKVISYLIVQQVWSTVVVLCSIDIICRFLSSLQQLVIIRKETG